MNKWAIDRFQDVGPLLPQNFQLIDTASEPMQLLYDMPIPHGRAALRADRSRPTRSRRIKVYTPVGTDPILRGVSPNAVEAGKERIERQADGVHVYMTAVRSHFAPDIDPRQAGRDRPHPPDEHRAGPRRDARLRDRGLQRQREHRARRALGHRVRGQHPGRVPALLHGVLLRAPPRDGGVPARRAPELSQARGREGRTRHRSVPSRPRISRLRESEFVP